MRDTIKNNIETHMSEYEAIVKTLYDHPEIGNEEYETAKLLCDYLSKRGFDVTSEFVTPTGFKAIYDSKKPGAKIAYLAEYDALPGVGHGCGHNLIAATSIAAGCALIDVVNKYGGSITVFGTPAEENFGGKVQQANAHAYDDYDAAMMVHPSDCNMLGEKTLALYPVKFEFFGESAHACQPYEGKSALDAAVMTFQGINQLRQFARANTYIHGVIKHGGEAANVIPDYASLEYYFRSDSMPYAQSLAQRAKEIAQGACTMCGTTFTTSVYECPYEDNIINVSLSELLRKEYENVGLQDIIDVESTPKGSSDIGAASYHCPTLQGYIKICDSDINGHSKEFANATLSPLGKQALHDGALALANVGYTLCSDENARQQVKAEFEDMMKTLGK